MKAAKTWCVAGFVMLAAFSSASCGKDEADGGGKAGSGNILPEGGSDGIGGTRNTGGSLSNGGTSGSATAAKLGSACVDDVDCADPKTPGLTCIKETDALLADGAPPKGLCTAECTADEGCAAFGAGALCYQFAEGDPGYCVEGCTFGAELGDPEKCHGRSEFACNPLFGSTDDPCETDDDCQAGDLCLGDTCSFVIPACLPACRGDKDCADGLYCDQSFLSGTCVEEKPVGKALGEPCTVGPEPDDCLGFCQADEQGSTEGHCTSTCGLFRECGWNSETEKYDGACFYGTIFTTDSPGAGEFGFCTVACNCTDECPSSELGCQLLPQGELNATFSGPGLCFSVDADTVEYNQCDGAGGNGSGGTGGAGAGGAGGEAGTPSEGGAGAGGAGG